jgi:hypothetical protein
LMPNCCTRAKQTMTLIWLDPRGQITEGLPSKRRASPRASFRLTGQPSRPPALKAVPVSVGRLRLITARTRSLRSSSRVIRLPALSQPFIVYAPEALPAPHDHRASRAALSRAPASPGAGSRQRSLKRSMPAELVWKAPSLKRVRAMGLRRSRYIGQERTHLQHLATAAAMNIARMVRWLNGTPQAQTRRSALAQLLRPAA